MLRFMLHDLMVYSNYVYSQANGCGKAVWRHNRQGYPAPAP